MDDVLLAEHAVLRELLGDAAAHRRLDGLGTKNECPLSACPKCDMISIVDLKCITIVCISSVYVQRVSTYCKLRNSNVHLNCVLIR